MSKNRAQHYLPAFYIYNFTNEDQKRESKGKKNRKTKVYHFDYSDKQIKERAIEKIAIEPYHLSYKDNDGKYNHSLDERLKAVETTSATAFQELNSLYEYISRKRPSAITLPDNIIDSVIELLVWQVARHPDLISEFEKESKIYLGENNIPDYSPKKMALDIVENIIDSNELDIKSEFESKNKTIICTTHEQSQFITSDSPFVRFNKHRNNGIGVEGTEMYYPLTNNMLLFMHGDGNEKRFVLNNDRTTLRKLNTYMAKHSTRYIIGKSDIYLNRIYKNVANK